MPKVVLTFSSDGRSTERAADANCHETLNANPHRPNTLGWKPLEQRVWKNEVFLKDPVCAAPRLLALSLVLFGSLFLSLSRFLSLLFHFR